MPTKKKRSAAKALKRVPEPDTMRPEYDFKKGIRGKHAAQYAEGTNVVVLERDVVRRNK